ncbi:MAG: N-acetylneuraminate synthase family protein [Alphaproteobacteria bacterium]|uniref:N-acetylneuraminate synthase family protein n=1 Tax=Candidatus Nitrobium versatile TaxID=2884831 RepID=A0A953J822_9BACT|nr:N-acetylneuraminate synthase family protein [Candidatus Nitrobium versatile]
MPDTSVPFVKIGDRTVGEGHPLLLIAEAANAHEGDFEKALQLVHAAADAGADAVKFQRFRAERLVTKGDPKLAHFKALEFDDTRWKGLITAARDRGLLFLADLFYEEAVEEMLSLGIDAVKIHSTDIANPRMLQALKGKGLPVLLSTGGSTPEEIGRALALLSPAEAVLMHGFQGFPTGIDDLHLRRMTTLKERYRLPVGLQDHVAGDSPLCPLIPFIAMGMGAAVVEKHITLDRSKKGIDYYSSLNPGEFRDMVSRIREAERAMGSNSMSMGENERTYRKRMKKFIVASKDLEKGKPVPPAALDFKRVGEGITPALADRISGRVLRRSVAADEPLLPGDIELNAVILIAVRMSSTRLPGKALIELEGRTTIEHLIDRLKGARVPKAIVLCTSTHPNDKVLLDIAERNGIKAFAGSEDDVMGRFLGAGEREGAEIVVRVTGDDILIDPVHLDKLVFHLFEKNADYACMTGLPKGTECEAISYKALKAAHERAIDSRWTEYMTYYLKVPELFTVVDMPVEERYTRKFRLTLDYAEDLEVLRTVFRNLYRKGEVFTLDELITFLDAHAEVLELNKEVKPKVLPPEMNTGLRL